MSSHHHVTNDEFLSHLTTLLSTTHSRTHGSVYLSQKSHPSDPSKVLIRLSNGANKPQRQEDAKSKVKYGTVVPVGELEAFYNRYADVCKKGMEGMRKRDKKKTKGKKKKGKGGGGEKGVKK